VQQDAALQVLAAGQKPAGMPADAEHLPFDVLQHQGQL
jgi:hypothetical protein